jgi:hypothetical protein
MMMQKPTENHFEMQQHNMPNLASCLLSLFELVYISVMSVLSAAMHSHLLFPCFCPAVYSLVLPKLALIADFEASYSGNGVSLTADGQAIGSCAKNPAPRIGAAGVSITSPGQGLCGSTGSVSPGSYRLSQQALTTPADVTLKSWACYDTSGGSSSTLFAGLNTAATPITLLLGLGDVVTCVADYKP